MSRLSGLHWKPGDVSARVLEAEHLIRSSGFKSPDPEIGFYQRLASRAEQMFEMEAQEDRRWKRSLEESKQDRSEKAAWLNLKVSGITDGLFLLTEMVESPIEAMFGAWAYMFGTDGCSDLSFSFGAEKMFHPEWGTIITPQVMVSNYRVDFLCTSCFRGNVRMLAVECDGHDFHERTPEQAARDRSRDRSFLNNGIQVVRFTGREIVRDVAACVDELNLALKLLTENLLADAGVEPRRSHPWIEETVGPGASPDGTAE